VGAKVILILPCAGAVCVADRVQPGAEIDAALWERFREDIRERKGAVRGHLRTELETALRQYLDDNSAPELSRVESKVDYLLSELDVDPADAPTPTPPQNERTHTHAPAEKPPANSATEKKVLWLASQVEAEVGDDFLEVPKATLRDVVKDEYGFRSDTAKRYVDELIEHFGLVDHPNNDVLLVTPERKDELMEQHREELRHEADHELNR